MTGTINPDTFDFSQLGPTKKKKEQKQTIDPETYDFSTLDQPELKTIQPPVEDKRIVKITGKEEMPYIANLQGLLLGRKHPRTFESSIGVRLNQLAKRKEDDTFLGQLFGGTESNMKKREERMKKASPKEYALWSMLGSNKLSIRQKIDRLNKIFPKANARIENAVAVMDVEVAPGVRQKMPIWSPTRKGGFLHREHNYKIFDVGNLSSKQANKMTIRAAMKFAVDQDAEVDILKKNIKNAFFSYDSFGNAIIHYTDKNGKERREYVNPKGITKEDVLKFVAQTPLYMAGGGVAGAIGKKIGAGMFTRMGLQGVGAGLTSAGVDSLAMLGGSKQGVSGERAIITSLFGAVGEGVATMLGKLIKSPNLMDMQGKLTKQGRREVKSAGMDPDAFQKRLDEAFNNNGEQVITKGGRTQDFDIPLSSGQATKDLKQLQEEELMRKGAFGDKPQATILGFDDNQNEAIKRATDVYRQRINPKENVIATEGDAATIISQGIKGRYARMALKVDDNYSQIGQGSTAALSKDSFNDLTNIIKGEFVDTIAPTEIGGLNVLGGNFGKAASKELTPGTTLALSKLSSLNKTLQGTKDKAGLDGITLSTIYEYRKYVNQLLNGAKGPDKVNLSTIKRTVDSWLENNINTVLINGDAKELAKLKTAISSRAELGYLFGKRINKSGKTDSIGAKLDQIVKDENLDDTKLLDWVFNKSHIGGKAEAKAIVERIIEIVGKGSKEYNALRQGAFLRLEKGVVKDGRFNKQRFINNVEEALDKSGASVMRVLFNESERKALRKLAQEIKHANPQIFNPSGTAGSLGALGISFLERFGLAKVFSGSLAANAETVGTGGGLMAVSALGRFFAKRRAQRAIKGLPKPGEVPPYLRAPFVSSGAVSRGNREQPPKN